MTLLMYFDIESKTNTQHNLIVVWLEIQVLTLYCTIFGSSASAAI